MPKKIRVYELAKELGLTNKEGLELALSLGIGVKSHSSSIEDAQADRVRRKADAEGLRRPVQPEEPAPAKKAAKATKATKSARAVSAAGRHRRPTTAPAAAAARPAASAPAATLRPGQEDGAVRVELGRAERRPGSRRRRRARRTPRLRHRGPGDVARRRRARRPAHRGRISSRPTPPTGPGTGRPGTRPAARRRTALPRHTSGTAGPAAHAPDTAAPGAPAGPPARHADPRLSPSGRPVPPPPGTRPPLGPSGRPIPPPPGMGGRRPSAPPSRPPGGGAYPPRHRRPPARAPAGRAVDPAARRVAVASEAGPRVAASEAARRWRRARRCTAPAVGAVVAAWPGRRPSQRRARRRRRRNLEELEPTQLTTYQPSTAPVPDGEVIIERGSTARDLGPKLNRSAGDIVRFLLLQGEMVMATQSLTDDMIELFAAEIGADVRLVDPGEEQEAELLARYFEDEDEEDEADQRPRARRSSP